MTAFPFRTLLLAGAVALPASAWAADVTPEQARAAEAALHDWVASYVGSSFKTPDRPVILTPAGDHFDAVVPFGAFGQPSDQPVTQLTARVRPLDGGKWAVEGMRIQTPVTVTLQVPVPPPDGAPKDAPRKTTPVTYTFDMQGQDGGGTIDPALTGPVTWTASNTGLTLKVVGGPLPHDVTAGPSSSVNVVTPTGPDTVDLSFKTTTQDYHMVPAADSPAAVEATIKRIAVALSATGLHRTALRDLTQATFKVLAAQSSVPQSSATPPPAAKSPAAPGTPPAPPAISPEVAATMIHALQDFAGAMSLDEEADGVAVTAMGVPVAMERAVLSINGKSVDGILQAGMTISAIGLAIQGVLPPDMAGLVPTEVTVRPVVTGIGVPEAARMLTAASEKKNPNPADIQAMFSHGGITVGVESMTVAVAGATFGGHGAVVFTSPEAYTGTAHITATGFDNLMQKVVAIPAFQQQAMPVFALVKGMGKTVGNELVWDVAYANGAATVNGMAIPGLGGPPPPPPAQPAQPAPRRPAQPQRPQAR